MAESVLNLLGKVDNLNDPEPILNRKAAVFGVTITFLVFSSLCAIGRLCIRSFGGAHKLGWDDFFVVLAVFSNIAQAVGTCLSANKGLGQHFILLGVDGMSSFIHTFYSANGTYPMSVTFIKLALLFQYLRIFEVGTKLWTTTVVTILVVAMWGFAFSFLAWVPCIPVRAYWDWTITDSETIRYGYGSHDPASFVATYLSNAVLSLILDLVVFAIPMPLALEHDVSRRTRLALVGLFVLGAVVNISSVLRLVTLAEHKAGTYPTLDPSWYGCTPAVLAVVEVNLATICASLPVFWPAIQQSLGKIVVTHEVQITRETRDFGGGFNHLDDGEIISMEAITSKQGEFRDRDDFTGTAVSPLPSPLRSPAPTANNSTANIHVANDTPTPPSLSNHRHSQIGANGSLDLGADFGASVGSFGSRRWVAGYKEASSGSLNV